MDTRSVESSIAGLSVDQHGLVTVQQLRDLGVTRSQIRHQLERGRLRRESSMVLSVAAAPGSSLRTVLAAVLDLGVEACASHTTAAAIWGIPGFDLVPAHVTGPRRRARRDHDFLGVVHEPRLLDRMHVTSVEGVPVTTPGRTIFDLAGAPSVHPKRVARALDTLLVRRLTTMGRLEALLGRLARRGRPGISVMRELIAERSGDYVPPESNAEVRFIELLRQWGLPSFRHQVDLGDGCDWIGRVDFVHPTLPLVVEVDSVRYHGSFSDRRRDIDRHRRLGEEGFVVVSLSDHDLFHHSDECGRRVRSAVLRLELDRSSVA